MFNYSKIITSYNNERNESFEPVPKAHVRIGATIDASRTMRDKANQSVIAGKSVTRCAWFVVAPQVAIRVWADKEGRFSFGEDYVDVPYYQARKMGIVGDYMSLIASDGVFSKKEQEEKSKPHGASCRCIGHMCGIVF